MKKILIAILLIGSLAFIGNLVFSADHFTEVLIKAEVSAYDYVTEEFGEAVLIEEQEELELLSQTLNEANHKNSSYEIARVEDYKVELTYEDGMTDTLRVWFDFGEGYDMFLTDKKVGSYTLKDDEAREALQKILK